MNTPETNKQIVLEEMVKELEQTIAELNRQMEQGIAEVPVSGRG